MNVPENLIYTREHEWIAVENDVGTIGITEHAQSELGDVVFAELPVPPKDFAEGESFGSVESVKAVSEVYMPVDGEVIEVNALLEDAPETVNEDPYGKGWMIKIQIKNSSQLESLMSAQQYSEYVKEESQS